MTESKTFLVFRVVQVGKEVRGPGDGVGLARPRRVLDQVLAAGALGLDGLLQLSRYGKLVVAREDVRGELLFVIALRYQVAAQDFKEARPLPNLLPQVAGAVAP